MRRRVTYDTHEEWLNARRDGYGVGASTVGAILGASSYRSPWDVWAAEYAPDAIGAGNIAQLQRGHLLERHVLRFYSERENIEVEHLDRAIWYHDAQPWARFSPDGVRADGGLVEVKTVRGGWDWRDVSDVIESAEELEYLPSLNYGLQCHWQMLVSGAPFVDLVILPMGHELAAVADLLAVSDWPEAMTVVAEGLRSSMIVVRLLRDAVFEARLGAKVAAWRERHLVNGEEPPASGAHASAHHGRVPKRGELEIDLDHPVTLVADSLFDAKREKKVIDARVKSLTGRLKKALQHVETVKTGRGSIAWRRAGRGKTLDLRQWVHGGTTDCDLNPEPLNPPEPQDTEREDG